MEYEKITFPKTGKKIENIEHGTLNVPDNPVIPFIEGDGVGPDIWKASQKVFDEAIKKSYQGKRKITWFEIFAGEKGVQKYGENQWLPNDTLKAIEDCIVAIKGPLTTPVGGGISSLNVALRQKLDLYACIRPTRWFNGVPSPVKNPGKLDVIIFRENTEDVYAGIEWKEASKEAESIIRWFNSGFLKQLNKSIRTDSGIGIKPISVTASKKLIGRAIQYAIDNKRSSVTLVHKGNIMKFTEGAFRDWGFELAKDNFSDHVISESDLWEKYDGNIPEGKILIKDRIADAMFQQLLLRPNEYDVIATTNLNGDYLSDACAAQVGGLGLAPGANIGDCVALFEATHGTAPKYAGMDKVNPGSLILSGVMMLEHMGWEESAEMIIRAIKKTIEDKTVTYDLERQMENSTLLSCSGFAQAIIDNM